MNKPPAPSQAIALHYDSVSAPKVVAKAEGRLADEIVALAIESGVHVHEDAELAGFLTRVELDTEIPRELYLAVAKVIAFAYVLKDKFPAGKAAQDYETREP